MKFLKLLTLTILFFACKSEKCVIPDCPTPNINIYSILEITFDSSFSEEELSEVFFTTKRIGSDDIVSIDTITNLQETNFQITIGAIDRGGQFIFGEQRSGINALQFVEYFYEVEIPETNHFYILNELKFKSDDDPCRCPDYNFESAILNDSLVILELNTLTLKK
ncbi:MAG: hypothetical protein AB8H03_10845 [Saprospiraceae bacterium]